MERRIDAEGEKLGKKKTSKVTSRHLILYVKFWLRISDLNPVTLKLLSCFQDLRVESEYDCQVGALINCNRDVVEKVRNSPRKGHS